jgi:dihydrofolate reductase
MRKLIVSQVVSLDGFTTAPDGSFVPPPWSDQVAQEWSGWAMETGGVFLYGRTNFVYQHGFWGAAETDPDSPAAGIPYAKVLNAFPKLVASRTLPDNPGWNARRIGDDLAAEISALKAEPGRDIISFGGATLARSLGELDLIDGYRLMIAPYLLGAGKRLFPEGVNRDFELTECKPMDVGSVIVSYARKR